VDLLSRPVSSGLTKLKIQRATLYRLYLSLVSLVGLGLISWGIFQFSTFPDTFDLFLLVGLAVVSAVVSAYVTASVQVEQSGVTYSVGPAVSMAAIPIWGPLAAGVISACFVLSLWLFKAKDQTTWKKSGAQLAFNTGSHAIAFFVGGWVLKGLSDLLGNNLLGNTLPWLVGSFIYDEVNIWLLIGVLRLQHGPQFKPLEFWRTERWSSQISILLLAIGGGLLAYAIRAFGWLGILIFYLPIVLSAYAFQLYVRQMRHYMDNLEQIVADRTKDLADLNRQKDVYLAVLTHDMMTPLSSIQLCAEELQADPTAAVDNPNLTRMMLRSQRTLFNMVRDILDIEKLQSGHALSAQRHPCDVAQLLAHVISIAQAEADGRNIRLDYKVAEPTLVIFADRHQIERILLNLIANAIKYTPTGGSVSASAQIKGQQMVIEVRDTGYGIPAEELPYIFDRFRRVEQLKDKATGTGLGLAITKALVEEHGGQIVVHSELGKGSLFTVIIPIQAEGRVEPI
jgi:signal transduction histidine kinase